MIKENEIFELNWKKMFFEKNWIIDFETWKVLKTFSKIEKIFYQDWKYFFLINLEEPYPWICNIYYWQISNFNWENIFEEKNLNIYTSCSSWTFYFNNQKRVYEIWDYNFENSWPWKSWKITIKEVKEKNKTDSTILSSMEFTWTWNLEINYQVNNYEKEKFPFDFLIFLAIWLSWMFFILKVWLFRLFRNIF